MTATTAKTIITQSITKRGALRAGVVAGVISAVLANIALLLLTDITGKSFAQLSHLSVTVASVVPNLFGSMIYYYLVKKTSRASGIYAIITLTLATADSIMQAIAAPASGFAMIANPLHYIVAFSSILVIPRFLHKSYK